LDEYPEAIKLYEKVAKHSLASPLTKYSVKEYWFRSGLCALAMGVSGSPVSEYPVIASSSGYCNRKEADGEL
jgi:hypothetical protein